MNWRIFMELPMFELRMHQMDGSDEDQISVMRVSGLPGSLVALEII